MKLIRPTYLKGKLQVPGSKSHFIRVAILSLFNENSVLEISNIAKCDDDLATISFLESVGMNLKWNGNNLEISASPNKFPAEIKADQSGLLARILMTVYSLFAEGYKINGRGSLLNRKMTAEEKSLHAIGLEANLSNSFLPIKISGEIKSGEYFLDGSSGSQFLSGALIAFSQLKGKTILNVENLKSKPYIDLTIQTLADFGINIENQDYNKFIITEQQNCFCNRISIESDWSSAAFFVVGAVLSGEIEFYGLDPNSKQADRQILDVLDLAGIKYKWRDDVLYLKKQKYDGFEFNAEDCPDLIPILIVLALLANGNSKVSGVNRLKNKESSRASVLVSEFAKLGIEIVLSGNDFLIAPQRITSGRIDSHSDHRIAMTFSIAGLVSSGGIRIEKSECVSKSYPRFFEDLDNLMTENKN